MPLKFGSTVVLLMKIWVKQQRLNHIEIPKPHSIPQTGLKKKIEFILSSQFIVSLPCPLGLGIQKMEEVFKCGPLLMKVDCLCKKCNSYKAPLFHAEMHAAFAIAKAITLANEDADCLL